MKRNTILTFLVSALVFIQACAQTVPSDEPTGTTTRRERLAATTPEQRAERQTAQMKKQLSLTADQETNVAAINLKYAQQMQSVLETGGRNRTTMNQVRDMTSSKDAELKKVFDENQYKQYEAFKDERKDRMKQALGRRVNR